MNYFVFPNKCVTFVANNGAKGKPQQITNCLTIKNSRLWD